MNRFEKLEWLEQTCTEKFMKEEFALEMVRWMGEHEFEQFYEYLCRNWGIAGSLEELEETDFFNAPQELLEEWQQYIAKGYSGPSLSVGDIVQVDAEEYLCCSMGWEKRPENQALPL